MIRSIPFTTSLLLTLILGGGAAQAALITIPDSSLSSSPGVYTPGGYYTDALGTNIVTTGGGNAANVGGASGRNDDGYMALSLGFDVTFFGVSYSNLFVNNNGNVSFGSGISAYVPTGPTGTSAPIISPFFGDVDTRNPASDVVYYDLMTDQLIVTWNDVGYYNSRADVTNSFQLVLRSDDYLVPAGEGSIGFFYQNMGWDATDTNTVAAVGFGDGSGNGNVLESSLQSGLNSIVEDSYLWFNTNLEPVPPSAPAPVPVPGSLFLMAVGLFSGLVVSTRQRKV